MGSRLNSLPLFKSYILWINLYIILYYKEYKYIREYTKRGEIYKYI